MKLKEKEMFDLCLVLGNNDFTQNKDCTLLHNYAFDVFNSDIIVSFFVFLSYFEYHDRFRIMAMIC